MNQFKDISDLCLICAYRRLGGKNGKGDLVFRGVSRRGELEKELKSRRLWTDLCPQCSTVWDKKTYTRIMGDPSCQECGMIIPGAEV